MEPSGSNDGHLTVAKELHAGHYDQLRYLWCDNGNVIRAKTLFLPTFLARHGQEEALDCLGHLEDAVTITAALQALPATVDAPAPDAGLAPVEDVRALGALDPDDSVQCISCHDPHATAADYGEAEFRNLRWSYTHAPGSTAAFCRNCHSAK